MRLINWLIRQTFGKKFSPWIKEYLSNPASK
jgi:hypothetical protein